MFGPQETKCWSLGKQWFGSRKSFVGVQETNGWSPTTNGLVPSKPMGVAQEINGWDPGNQWLETRISMVGAKETNEWGPTKAMAGAQETNWGPGNQWLVLSNQWLESRKSIVGAQETNG